MKVCPDCKATYEDDVEQCENDGAVLILADGSPLPDNPELQEVLKVSPTEATAMVDLEAMEDKFRERAAERAEIEAKQAEEDEREALRDDPEATGTIGVSDLKRLRGEVGELEDFGDDDETPSNTAAAPAPQWDEKTGTGTGTGTGTFTEHTEVTRRRDGKERNKALPVLVVALGLLGAVIVAGGLYYYLGYGRALLTVTTVPPGATVLLDGKEVGLTTLQHRVKPGPHTLELNLEGYESFREVVEVPKQGLGFLQPLKAKAKGETPEPAADAGVTDGGEVAVPVDEQGGSELDALEREIRRLIKDRDFDEAFKKVKAFITTAPDDPRGELLLDLLARARAGGGKGRRGRGRVTKRPDRSNPAFKLTGAARLKAARSAYQEGERLYKAGRIDEAKLKFKESIQLDGKSFLPHRSIARIYQREGNKSRAVYHLKRYLALGGPDRDFKVRRYIDENK